MTEEQKQRQWRIIIGGTSDEAYEFAKNVEGADILALQNVAIKREDPEQIYEFARDIKGSDPLKAQDGLAEIWIGCQSLSKDDDEDTKNWINIVYNTLYSFARDIKGINQEKMWKMLQWSDNHLFAGRLENSYSDSEFLIKLAREIPCASVNKVSGHIAYPKDAYEFAKEFKDSIDADALFHTMKWRVDYWEEIAFQYRDAQKGVYAHLKQEAQDFLDTYKNQAEWLHKFANEFEVKDKESMKRFAHKFDSSKEKAD